MALSALVSVSTPTVAFATRIRTITPGSTSELQPSPSASPMSSDTAAAAIRIFTSKSSNCFSTSFQNGVGIGRQFVRAPTPSLRGVRLAQAHRGVHVEVREDLEEIEGGVGEVGSVSRTVGAFRSRRARVRRPSSPRVSRSNGS